MIVKTIKIAKRWIMIVLGFTLLVFGLILAIPGVPGPGLVVIWAGLAILAAEFLWARKLLQKFQTQGSRLKDLFFNRKKSGETQAKPEPSIETDSRQIENQVPPNDRKK
jgi:uncharacterized protein (TIGR02611 family)